MQTTAHAATPQALQQAIGLLKSMSHPVRLSLLCNLAHNGEQSVTQLIAAENGSASQSQISQFLARMRQEGLVEARREAQTIYYRLSSAHARKVIQALCDIYGT